MPEDALGRTHATGAGSGGTTGLQALPAAGRANVSCWCQRACLAAPVLVQLATVKILFLAPQPFFRERGTPLRARNILRALGEAGHEVDLLCYPFGQNIELPGVRLYRSPGCPGIRDVGVGPSLVKIPLDGLMFLKAAAMCARRRYDVIQAIEEASFFGVWLKRMFGAHLVYDMDSYISEQLIFSGFATGGPLLAMAKCLERRAMRAASLVVTVGPVHTAEVHRLSPSTTVLELPDAPLHDRFVENRDGADRLRAEFHLGQARVVVYTGNFEPYQGVDLLVGSTARVVRRHPDVRFVFAGGEPSQIEEMKRLAARIGSTDVCVFAGRRPPAEMTSFLSLATLLCTPRNKGANPPMKIYAYMQSGRPVVATRVPTHLQVLDDSVAYLADPRPDSLADTLILALDQPAVAAQRAAAAVARLEQRYSLALLKARIRNAFDFLARTPGTRRRPGQA